MRYEILPVGAFASNCVLLWNEGPQAWVVDPGEDAAVILDALARRRLTPSQIVLTHGHIDHIAALDALLARHRVPVFLHPAAALWAFTPANRLAPYLSVPARPETLAAVPDEGVLEAGGLAAKVLATPGHSPGSVCLYFEADGLLVTGDTLFAGSVGRTDLPGGDGRQLARSLRRLAALPESVTVIPGHGPTTSIGDERRDNPFLP